MADALLSTVSRLLAEQDRDPRLPWHDDPAGFARDCIDWGDRSIAPYQEKILAALATDHRVSVRSLHGVGKTTTAAIAVLWFAVTRDVAQVDWKCLMTAGGWRQLERFLLPEIHLWAKRIRWDVVGRPPFDPRTELHTLELKLSHGQAFAAASDDPQLLEGAHADSILIILDESKSIAAPVFDAVEGAMSGTGEAFALAMSTPGEPIGRFCEIQQRKPGLETWRVFHVTLDEAIGAGRVSRKWAQDRALQWGESSAIYQNRVLGEFCSSDEDSVIPLAWIEEAVERHQIWRDAGSPAGDGRTIIGVDVARSGADKTVLAVRQGPVVEFLERHRLDDTMAVVGEVLKYRSRSPMAIVDVIGIGAGVVDRLREQSFSVVAFHASERSTQRDRTYELSFLNQRAAAWWRMRELLDPTYESAVALPDDPELIGDLCAPKWRVNSSGKIQIEAKDEIRKRLGRSPDCADAVIMAFSQSSGASTSANEPPIRMRRGGSLFKPPASWGDGPLFDLPANDFDPDVPEDSDWSKAVSGGGPRYPPPWSNYVSAPRR